MIEAPEADEPPPLRWSNRAGEDSKPWLMLALLLVVGLAGFLITPTSTKGNCGRRQNAANAARCRDLHAVAEQGNIGVYINALGSVAPYTR